MTPFEFIFALFGLILGLSIVEMLGGLARALQTHGDVRIGWRTPLLGVLILLNVLAFWYGAWAMRDGKTLDQGSLLLPLLLSGAYYLAAAMVFPSADRQVADLDAHFMANKRLVLVVIGLCNIVALVISARAAPAVPRPDWWIVNALFLLVMAVTALTASARLALGGLIVLIAVQIFASLR